VYPFSLKPFLNAPAGSPEAKYTEHFVQTRSSSERCIGVLKERWRCLRKKGHYIINQNLQVLNHISHVI